MKEQLMTKEDQDQFAKKFGKNLDNLGIEIKGEKFKTGIQVSVWNKSDSEFIAYVGADFSNTISAEGSTYMESVANLVNKLGV